MRIFRSIIALAIAGVILTSTGSAQAKSSHFEAALELLTVMKIDRTIAQEMDIVLATLLKMSPAMEQYEDVFRTFVGKYMNGENLKERLAALYMSELDEPTLRDMIAFYRTVSGQIAVAKLPVLMQKVAALGQGEVQAHLPELDEAIKKRQEELDPSNHK
jgi:uncharacterized protein